MSSLRIAFATFVAGLTGFAQAEIEESKDWLITEREGSFFARMSTEKGYPVPPFTKGILVYGRQTGGTFDLLTVGGEYTDAKKLATAVDEWRAAAKLEGTVRYSTEPKGPAARFKIQTNRPFASEARTLIPVRFLIDRLKKLDPEVATVWYCPPFVETIGHEGTIRRTPKELITVFDFRRRSPEVFEVISRVEPRSYGIAAATVLVLPLLAWIGFALGHRGSLIGDPSGEERKSRFSKLFFTCLFVGYAIHLPLVGVMLSSTKEWADVWFGLSRGTTVVVPLMLLGFVGVLPVIRKVIKFEESHLATSRHVDPDVDARALEIQRALKKGGRAWQIGAFLVGAGFIVVSFVLGTKNALQLPLRMAGFALSLLAPVFISNWAFQNIPLPLDADEATSRLADEAAEAMGATPLPVRIVSDPLGKISITIMQKKHFFITRGFELDLTEAEKKFLFAQQYAFAWQPRKVNPWLVAMILVFVGSIVAMVAIGPSPHLSAATAAAMLILFVPGVLNRRQHDLRKLLAADREALDALRDPTAAMAALGKLQCGSKEAFEASFKTLWSTGALRQRIANIRERANELGLS